MSLFCFINKKIFIEIAKSDLIKNLKNYEKGDIVIFLCDKNTLVNKNFMKKIIFIIKRHDFKNINKNYLIDCYYEKNFFNFSINIKSKLLLDYSLLNKNNEYFNYCDELFKYDEKRLNKNLLKLTLNNKLFLIQNWKNLDEIFLKSLINENNMHLLCCYVNYKKYQNVTYYKSISILELWFLFFNINEESEILFRIINDIIERDMNLFLNLFLYHPLFYRKISKIFIKLIQKYPKIINLIEKYDNDKIYVLFNINKKELIHIAIHHNRKDLILYKNFTELNLNDIIDIFEKPLCSVPFNISKEEKLKIIAFILYKKINKETNLNILLQNDYFLNLTKNILYDYSEG